MSKKDHVNVDVPPARAKAPRFHKSRMAFRGLVVVLVGLGIWKAYDLIVSLLELYNRNRGTVHVIAVMSVVSLIVLGLWLMVRARRADKESQRPVSATPPRAKNPAPPGD